ncbi:cytochrome P450 [Micromonospora sp. WMMD1120]|uniref:cytochrome P450 n=1 Tax=Micromonospora sp. WMMD1120 TaxID=3016106 RepID=UPI002416DC29|nr:cytochrome P450 [Micromonospora sp. WMMD1120]MDG4810836.1 cytochrome P450 [Micromonospora sp. WMMD1120]
MTDLRTVPDLSDPDLYRTGETEHLWARLRADSPVFYTERAGARGFWSVLRHGHAEQVLRNNRDFTSTKGMRLDDDPAATASSAGKMLIVTDPPRHGKIRGVMNSAFTPRMVRRLQDNMRTTVTRLLADSPDGEPFDFTEVAARLPVSVICDMLGVPQADWDYMLRLTMTAFGAVPPDGDTSGPAEAHTEILLYYDDLMRRRRRDPQDDIVSALVHAEVDGARLSDEEIFLNCDGLISGGNETTRHASVGGLLALVGNPGELRRLREDPDLLPTAVAEILRWTSPALHVLRTAVADVELGDDRIATGDAVAVWLPSANRDESVFADGDRFDVGRKPNRHLTFAAGTHFCLGAALANTELSVLFEEILRHTAEIEIVGETRRMRSNLIWGFESLPVRWTRTTVSHQP